MKIAFTPSFTVAFMSAAVFPPGVATFDVIGTVILTVSYFGLKTCVYTKLISRPLSLITKAASYVLEISKVIYFLSKALFIYYATVSFSGFKYLI